MSFNDGIEKVSDQIFSVLMIGQSNMAGRGEFADVPKIKNPNCYMLRMGRWQAMREPVNPDRYIFLDEGAFHSGTSLAAAFADEYAKNENVKVGLIPCADGGTHLRDWMPGTLLYDHALAMTRLAMRTSTLSAIIWHQGEGDARTEKEVNTYKQRFITMINTLRSELGVCVPVVLGEISTNTAEKYMIGDRGPKLNKVFAEIAEELPLCALASQEGLTMKPDGIHFDAPSLRVFGKRYYEKFCEIRSRRVD